MGAQFFFLSSTRKINIQKFYQDINYYLSLGKERKWLRERNFLWKLWKNVILRDR